MQAHGAIKCHFMLCTLYHLSPSLLLSCMLFISSKHSTCSWLKWLSILCSSTTLRTILMSLALFGDLSGFFFFTMSPSTLVISQVFMFAASTTGYPNMTGPPTVSNAVLSSSVRFDCTVRPASLASTTYTVEWSSGGVVLLSSDLTGSATVHSLDSSSLNQASRNSILDNGVSTVI